MTADGPGLALFFAIGLLGGAHCLGMCGPLVTLYADRMAGRDNAVTWGEIRGHGLFNLGRTASYAAIGAALGLAGRTLFSAADVVAAGSVVRAVAGVGAGVAIAAVGVGYAARGTNALAGLEPGGAFGRVYGLLTDRVDAWVGGPRIAALGALHGLLPCPLLYPAYLYAFARGSPAEGALALGALGLGTFPTLFAYGTAFGSVSPAARVRLHRALGVAFVALAYLPLSMGLRAVGVNLPTLPVPFYQPLA